MSTQPSTNPHIMKLCSLGFLILSIAYNSGYALATVLNIKISLVLILPIFIILTIKKCLHTDIHIHSSPATIFLIIMLSGVLLTTIANFSTPTILSSLRFSLVMSTAFLISRTIKFHTFVDAFLKIIVILTVISLLIYIITNFFNIRLNLPIFTNVNGAQYESGFVFFILKDPVKASFVNSSIFWESGVYSSFLLIALIFELFFTEKKPRILFIILYITGIISTQSTAGILLLIPIFILMWIKQVKNNQIIWPSISLILIFIFSFFYKDILAYLTSNYTAIFSKLDIGRSTASTRILSPQINLNIWYENLYFGCGFKNAGITYDEAISAYGAQINAQTSTSTLILSALGIVGLSYTVAWIYAFCRIQNLNMIIKGTILFIFLIILNKEPHVHNLFIWCTLFYMLNFRRAPIPLTTRRE